MPPSNASRDPRSDASSARGARMGLGRALAFLAPALIGCAGAAVPPAGPDGAEAAVASPRPDASSAELPDVWIVSPEQGDLGFDWRTRLDVIELRFERAGAPASGLSPASVRVVLDGVELPWHGVDGEPLHIALPGAEHQLELWVADGLAPRPAHAGVVLATTARCRTSVEALLPDTRADRRIAVSPRTLCAGDTLAARE